MSLKEVLDKIRNEVDEQPIEYYPKFEENSVIIDVRETDEYNGGYLPGAIHIPRGVLEFKLSNMPEIKKDTHILLYCRSGNRSLYAARSLNELGYEKVTSLKGGYVAWAAANPTTLA